MKSKREWAVKLCKFCNVIKNADQFYLRKARKPHHNTYLSASCMECDRERVRLIAAADPLWRRAKEARYRDRNLDREKVRYKKFYLKNRDKVLGKHRAYYAINKNKKKTHQLVRLEIKAGRLKPVTICAHNKDYCKGRVEAHHCDYTKPLDLTWLCQRHHRAWHRVFLTEDYCE